MDRRGFLGLLASPLFAGVNEGRKRESTEEISASADSVLQFPGLELLKAQRLHLHNPTDTSQLLDIIIKEKRIQVQLGSQENRKESLYGIEGITDISLFGGKRIAATIECTPPQGYGPQIMLPAWQGLEERHIFASSSSTPTNPWITQGNQDMDFQFFAARELASTHYIPLEKSLLENILYRTIVRNVSEEDIFAHAIARKQNGIIWQESRNFYVPGCEQQPAPINMAMYLHNGNLVINASNRIGEAVSCDVQLDFEKFSHKKRVPSLTNRSLGTELAVLGIGHKEKGKEHVAEQVFVTYVPHTYESYIGNPNTQITIEAQLHSSRNNKWVHAAYTFPLRPGTTKRFLTIDLTSAARKFQYGGNISVHEFDYRNCNGNLVLRIPATDGHNQAGRIGALVVPSSYWHKPNQIIHIGQPYLAQRL